MQWNDIAPLPPANEPAWWAGEKILQQKYCWTQWNRFQRLPWGQIKGCYHCKLNSHLQSKRTLTTKQRKIHWVLPMSQCIFVKYFTAGRLTKGKIYPMPNLGLLLLIKGRGWALGDFHLFCGDLFFIFVYFFRVYFGWVFLFLFFFLTWGT